MEEKEMNIGEKLYKNFCKEYADIPVITPRITTLKIFYLLSKTGHYDLLVREMMKEFLSNIEDSEIVLDKNSIFRVSSKYEKL